MFLYSVDRFVLMLRRNSVLVCIYKDFCCVNVNKCVTLQLKCNRSLQPSSFIIFLDSEPLNCVTKHSYQDVLLTSSMSFSPHINSILAKASKILQWNLSKCSEEVKSTAYLGLVYPILEYSSPVWDLYLLSDIQSIEKVQRCTAQWCHLIIVGLIV